MKEIIADTILGVKVSFGFSMESVLHRIEAMLREPTKPHLICTTNAEFIMDAQKDSHFKSIINNASLSLPDGVGVLFAQYYLNGTKNIHNPLLKFLWGTIFGFLSLFKNFAVGEKISGVDLATEIFKLSAKKNYSIFLLGGWPKDLWGVPIKPAPFDMAQLTADTVKKLYPNVNIIGATSSFNRGPADDTVTVDYIKTCMKEHGIKELDFLFIAYNHKYQEDWYLRNAAKIPAKVGVGLGGTFDYLSGYLIRPTSYKFEWLKKIIMRPTKISRILRAFPLFPLLVFIDSTRK